MSRDQSPKSDQGRGDYSGPFTWNPETRQYLDSAGRAMPECYVKGAKMAVTNAMRSDVRHLTNQLKTGVITSQQWRDGLVQVSKNYRLALTALENGGASSLEGMDLTTVESVVAADLARIEGMTADVIREVEDADALFAMLFALSDTEIFEAPPELEDKPRRGRPKGSAAKLEFTSLAQQTFYELRQVDRSLIDGPTGSLWQEVRGALAILHSEPDATIATRFEPTQQLRNWWGHPTLDATHLFEEIRNLPLDARITLHVVVASLLHSDDLYIKTSLDDIIRLIGRDTDARRSTKEREQLRKNVWRWLNIFASLITVGVRPGAWYEPGQDGKPQKIKGEDLYSRSPLIVFTGITETEQGTFDGSAPPKTVSIVPGDWLRRHARNRRMLGEFGNVLAIASLPRGKRAGAWAVCIGLRLNQEWRERASRSEIKRVSHGGEQKTETMNFGTFTRQQLLADTIGTEFDYSTLVTDKKSGHRARDYWSEAIKMLKEAGVIGHYAELRVDSGLKWPEDWLTQTLDIRPKGEILGNAIEIKKAAAQVEARTRRARGRRASTKSPRKRDK